MPNFTLKHFRDVTFVVFCLNDETFERPLRADAKARPAKCPASVSFEAVVKQSGTTILVILVPALWDGHVA